MALEQLVNSCVAQGIADGREWAARAGGLLIAQDEDEFEEFDEFEDDEDEEFDEFGDDEEYEEDLEDDFDDDEDEDL